MFERILVPVDLSGRSHRVLEMAAQLAAPSEGVVHLFHVIETLDPSVEDELGPFYERLERVAREHLDTLGERLSALNASWEAEVILGHREADILRRADELEVDVVALQSHPVDRDNLHEGWASLSYHIAIFSNRPVLLVK